MIAVADTSPICYLILIGEIDLLPKLFSQVLVPEAVLAELLHEDAPTGGSKLGVQPTILDSRQRDSTLGNRGTGETSGW